MLTDEYQLDLTVAILFVPVLCDIGIFLQKLLSLTLGSCCEPLARLGSCDLNACLLEYICVVSVVGEPEHTLAADNSLGPVVSPVLELVLIKGTAAVIYECADAVFLGFALIVVMVVVMMVVTVMLVVVIVVIIVIVVMMLMFMLVVIVVIIMVMVMLMFIMLIFVMIFVCALFISLSPASRCDSLFKIIAVCVEDIGNIYLAEACFDYSCLGLESLDHSLYSCQLLLCYLIYLVENDSCAELDLLNEKILDILFAHIFVEKSIAAAELGRHAECVNNCNDVVQTADSGLTLVNLALQNGNGLCDRQRLADTACFDEQVIKLACLDKVCDLIHKIDFKCAADAAVGKGNEVIVLLSNSAALLDKLRINVYLADIIYDNSALIALLIVEDVIDKSCFSCAQIACKQGNGYEIFLLCHIYLPFMVIIHFYRITVYHS